MPRKKMQLSESAQKVLAMAEEEAIRFSHNYIGTEHLTLGIVRDPETIAAQILTNMGIRLPKVRSAVEFIVGSEEKYVEGERALTGRAKRVIELAIEEARQLGSSSVHSEHILLGLIREGDGIGAGVLESLGARLERVRPQLMRAMASGLMLSEDEFQELENVVAHLTLFEQLFALNVPAAAVSILNAHVDWKPEKLAAAGTQPETFEILKSMFRRAVQPFQDVNHVCLGFVSLHAMATDEITQLDHGQVCPFCSMIVKSLRESHSSHEALSSQ